MKATGWTDEVKINYHSPIGLIQIKSINHKICSVLFVEKETEALMIDSPLTKECIKQLKEYSDGSLTGYAWGLDKKEWLLKHEIEHSGPVEGRLF